MNIKKVIRFASLLFLVIIGACKNKAVDYSLFEIKDEHIQAESTNAVISGSYSFDGEVNGMKFNIGLDEKLTDAITYEMLLEGDAFSITLDSLIPNTTYYYCYNVDFGLQKDYLTEVSSFRTLKGDSGLPKVTTSEVSEITSISARCGGEVLNEGDSHVIRRGVCWSTEQQPTIENDTTVNDSGLGEFVSVLTNLIPYTTYYVRAYATNSTGTSYGAEVSFTALDGLPEVITLNVTDVGDDSAVGHGEVINEGASEVTERGICWSTIHTPTIANSNAQATQGGMGSYSVNMTNLAQNTTYYVRAYAKNGAGIAYGSEAPFTTSQSISAPTVTTSQVINFTQTTATGGGNVVNDGGASVTERGICWSTSHDPTTSGSHDSSGTGTGTYTVNMTNLTAGTTYYVRAYAINSMGTSYGDEVSFTTLSNGEAPIGAINSLFTINDNGDQVYFSQGNLQYQASTNTWRFATNQYDYIGNYNNNISQTYSGWIDLFGWGTSRYHDNSDPYNVNYQPWSTSTSTVNETYNGFGYGPSTNMPSPNLTGSSAHYDWGVHNAISNGGGQPGQWRTLTGGSDGEWEHIFKKRSTRSGIRYAKAQVVGVNGIILLPDNWNASTFNLSNPDEEDASYTSNVISATEWHTLQDVGAVFLPAAGYRNEYWSYAVGSFGYYWSASYYNSDNAFGMYFTNSNLNYTNSSWFPRYYGRSVRLVCPAP